MTQPNPSTAMARAIVDELAAGGVSLVVVAPGSRSAALAIAADSHPGLEVVTSIDERSGAFHALGWGKATALPAAVISTSGTAPANFLPAVIESEMSLTPLVIVSADRPEEMRGVGANQTIDQFGLFGSHVRTFAHIEAPPPGHDGNAGWRSAVAEIVATARGAKGRPGPVHLNVAFREPTVPVTDDGRTASEEYSFDITGTDGGVPWARFDIPPPPMAGDYGIPEGRGIVIAGEGEYDRGRLADAASRLGWPILATSLSGMRGGWVISRYHHLLAAGVPGALRPDLVFAVGAIGPSQRLEDLVSSADTRVRVDYWGRVLDPRRSATHVLHSDPSATLELLAETREPVTGWAEHWRAADEATGLATDEFLANSDRPSGAMVARALGDIDWSTLVAASSLPVREVDAHVHRPGIVVANRGASGIDGFVSTALGVARFGARCVALSGDLSLLHDSNGFLIDPLPSLVLVVVDNDGGGLFDSLPTARHAPSFERLFVTPHGRDLAGLASWLGLDFSEASSRVGLVEAVDGYLESGRTALVRVGVDRSADFTVRQALDRLGGEVASEFDA